MESAVVYRVSYADWIGKRFGKLTVIGIAREGTGKLGTRLLCRCDCGNEATPQPYPLKDGRTQSCGCLGQERRTKHGQAYGKNGSKTYTAWSQMKSRCDNPKNKFYADYGGRGIVYCEEWKDFKAFFSDMGEAPEGLSLERIENSKGYSKENCKWATRKEQQNNRRNTKMIEYNGKMWPKQIIAAEFGIDPHTLMNRLKRGWPVEKALTYPVDKSKATASKRI
jgi:hypothetical protein